MISEQYTCSWIELLKCYLIIKFDGMIMRDQLINTGDDTIWAKLFITDVILEP